MWIRVGSINPTKVSAVEEYFFDLNLPLERGERVEVEAVDVPSEVREQPIGLGEITHGANNRACYAKGDADLGVGIESGIIDAPYTGSGYMNVVICSLYDGTADFKIGMGSGFEVPRGAINICFRDNVDLSEAFRRGEFTTEERIGYGKGLIHTLTNGKLDRKQYIKQAIEMAMVQYRHPKWFGEHGSGLEVHGPLVRATMIDNLPP